VTKLHRATLPLLAVVILASACDNSYGCLAGIQAEIEQKGNEAFRRTSVSRVLRFDDRYYAATATLYSRSAAAGVWAPVPVAGNSSYSLLSIANDGDTTLYASIYADGANTLHSYDGTNWTDIDAADIPATAWIDGLFMANGTLFAQSHDNYANSSADTYSLYYLSGAALVALADSDLTVQTLPFVDVAWDGSEHWFARQNALLHGGAAATDPVDASSAFTTSSYTALSSMRYSATGAALFIGTVSGHVVKCSGAGAPTSQDLGSSPVIALGDDGTSIYAGFGITTSARLGGYFLGSPAAPLALATGEDGAIDQYSTTVDGRAVLDFFWDSTGGRFFVCVAPGADSTGYGLYSTTLAGHAWIAE